MFSTSNNAFGRAGLALLAFVASLSPISAHAEDMGSYACPVRGDAIEKVTEETKFSDFHGVRYYFWVYRLSCG